MFRREKEKEFAKGSEVKGFSPSLQSAKAEAKSACKERERERESERVRESENEMEKADYVYSDIFANNIFACSFSFFLSHRGSKTDNVARVTSCTFTL